MSFQNIYSAKIIQKNIYSVEQVKSQVFLHDPSKIDSIINQSILLIKVNGFLTQKYEYGPVKRRVD